MKSTDSSLSEIKSLITNKQFMEAQQKLLSYLKTKPSYIAYILLAESCFCLENDKEALAVLDKAEKLNRKDPLVYSIRGQLLYRANPLSKQALEQLSKAIELKTLDWYPYFIRATIYIEAEDYKKAISDYNEAIKNGMNHEMVWVNRGKCNEMLKLYKDACKDYTKALSLKESFKAYRNRATCYGELAEYKKALKDTKSAIEFAKTDDDRINIYLYKSIIYFKAKKRIKALQNVKKALKLKPENLETYAEHLKMICETYLMCHQDKELLIQILVTLIESYKRNDNSKALITYCHKLLELDENHIGANFELGTSYINKARLILDKNSSKKKELLEDGIRYLKKAADGDHKHIIARYNLAIANEVLGNNAETMKSYEQVISQTDESRRASQPLTADLASYKRYITALERLVILTIKLEGEEKAKELSIKLLTHEPNYKTKNQRLSRYLQKIKTLTPAKTNSNEISIDHSQLQSRQGHEQHEAKLDDTQINQADTMPTNTKLLHRRHQVGMFKSVEEQRTEVNAAQNNDDADTLCALIRNRCTIS